MEDELRLRGFIYSGELEAAGGIPIAVVVPTEAMASYGHGCSRWSQLEEREAMKRVDIGSY